MKNENILLTPYKYNNIIIINNNTFEMINELKGHNSDILQARELMNENIISCSADKTIRLWEKNNNIYESKKIIEEEFPIRNVLELKNNIIVYDNKNKDKSICFYDLNNNTYVWKISNIINNANALLNSFVLINNNILLYGSTNIFYMFDVNEYKLISSVNVNNEKFLSLYPLTENMILCGSDKGKISQYKYENNELKLISVKNNVHSKIIRGLYYMKNGYVVSGSDDKYFKVFK